MPGWRLRINGQPADVVPTNVVFLGARVEAGTSRLEFYYSPTLWRVGLLLTLCAASAILSIGLSELRYRSRQDP